MVVIHQLTKIRQDFGPPLFPSTNYDMRILPEFHWVLAEFAIFVIAEEIAFYYSHKLAHHPKVTLTNFYFTSMESGLVKLFSIDFVVIQARPQTAPRVDISCRFNGFVCPSFGARSVKHVSSFSWPAHLRKSHSNQVKRDCL